MALTKTDAPGEEASSNVKTGQLARMITEIGPNISEIARQLGQFKESVRYRSVSYTHLDVYKRQAV